MRRAALAALVSAFVLALGALPVGAGVDPPPTTGAPAPDAPRVLLVQQPAWVTAGGTLPLALRVQGEGTTAPDLQISITAHQAATTRTSYDAALRGEGLRSPLGHVDIPLAQLPTGAAGVRTITIGLEPEGPFGLSRTGVYPFQVELRDQNDNRLDGFVTPVVVAAPDASGAAVGQRLGVTWVMPMVARPAFQADGQADPDVVAQLRPEGRLGGRAVTIANSDVPLTLAPGPETLESWTQLANDDPALATSLNAMRDALGGAQVLAGPYVPIDVRSLVGGGLSDQVGSELVQGTERLSALLGTRVDPRTEIADPANEASLARLRTAFVDRVILDGADLAPREDQFTPAQPFVVRTEQGAATAVGSDPGLQRLLEGDGPPALRAQRFLAGLSVVALELPNVTRGVVVLAPEDWDASSELLAPALAGLSSDHPLLQALTVDELLGTVPAATSDNAPVERQLAPSPVPAPPVTQREFLEAESRLNAFNALVPPPNPVAEPGSKSLLVSLSSMWSGASGRARARAELGKIDLGVNQFVSRLRVPAGNSTITLTASKGAIPVTFLNETGQPLRVRVRLESDKLQFPDGDERILDLPPRSTTVRFDVETGSSGTFPLTLNVTSPDGNLPIQQTEVQVRTTFFVSNVGVFITVGAVLFLALWWGNDIRRRRRRRAAQVATPEHPALSSPPAAPGAGQSSGQSSAP